MKVKMMRFILFLLCLTGFAQVSGQKMTEFEQLVEELRLDENVVDLSDSGNFSLDEPRLAYANLTGISTMPRSTMARDTIFASGSSFTDREVIPCGIRKTMHRSLFARTTGKANSPPTYDLAIG